MNRKDMKIQTSAKHGTSVEYTSDHFSIEVDSNAAGKWS